MPENAYLGMYIDGEGPSGIIRDLPAEQTVYYRFLPMVYPYLIKQAPDTFVVQFGGGISTSVALRSNSKSVTVAEGNPAVLDAFRTDKGLRDFTGDVLNNPKVHVVDYDGRLYLAHTAERYDVIDLSLADSAGLSSPGGFAIVEKYSYTREAMTSYMRALRDGGVLSVTMWNKEEPPKSVLKLYTTMAAAAREVDDGDIANRFFVVSSYLSTATVLYKRGGFDADDIAKLREHTRAMSFDEIYYPGFEYDTAQTAKVLEDYRHQIFFEGASQSGPHGRVHAGGRHRRRTEPRRTRRRRPDPAGKAGRGGAGDGHGPNWPGTIWSTAAGMTSPSATCSIPGRSPTSGRTSPPTSNRATSRASPTGSNCCRTSGAICCCGQRSPSPAWPRCRSCSFRSSSAGARSSATTPASSAPSSISPAWAPATSWLRWA